MTSESRHSFLEHLEELRFLIFKLLLIIFIMTAISFYFSDDIIKIILRPIDHVKCANPQFAVSTILTSPFDGIIIRLKVSLLFGVLLSVPLILFFVYLFTRSAFSDREKFLCFWCIITGGVLFISGSILSYFSISYVIAVILNYSVTGSENLWTLKSIINFLFYWIMGAGIVFQIPFVILFLIKTKMINSKRIKKARPYFYIGSFIFAAIVTPPDPFTMVLAGLPMVLLFEFGIILSKIKLKRKCYD